MVMKWILPALSDQRKSKGVATHEKWEQHKSIVSEFVDNGKD